MKESLARRCTIGRLCPAKQSVTCSCTSPTPTSSLRSGQFCSSRDLFILNCRLSSTLNFLKSCTNRVVDFVTKAFLIIPRSGYFVKSPTLTAGRVGHRYKPRITSFTNFRPSPYLNRKLFEKRNNLNSIHLLI
jgi:hypothetical protein